MTGVARVALVLVVVLVVAGAGAAALHLAARRSEAVPAATASQLATRPDAPAFPTKRCTLAWPESWAKALEEQPQQSGPFEVVPGQPDARIAISYEGTLTWESPEGDYPITQRANPNFLYRITDGRFVVFLDENNQVTAWDREHPEAAPRALTQFPADSTQSWFWVADGYVWLQGFDAATNEITVSVVELAAGTSATEVARGADLDVYNALGDTVQVVDDGEVRLYRRDGTAEALPTELHGYAITGVLDGVYVLTPLTGEPGGASVLWHPEWAEPFQLDGLATGLIGDGWVALEERRFFNYETGVTVEAADATSGFLEAIPVINADGYLWWTAVAEDDPLPWGDVDGKLLPLAELPKVGCEA